MNKLTLLLHIRHKMNNFYCEFQDLVSSWLIQINDFFLKFVFSDVINFILKIKSTKYSIGFISRKKNWKNLWKPAPDNCSIFGDWTLQLFFIKIGDWPSSLVWKQPLWHYFVSSIEKTSSTNSYAWTIRNLKARLPASPHKALSVIGEHTVFWNTFNYAIRNKSNTYYKWVPL